MVNDHGEIEEISFLELLRKQFSGEVDAGTAEIELCKYKWEPFKKSNQTQSVSAVRTH